MNSSSTVSAEVGLRLVTTPQTIVPLTGSLFSSRQDPYAVRIAFHVGLEEPVELNDLLRQASLRNHPDYMTAAHLAGREARKQSEASHEPLSNFAVDVIDAGAHIREAPIISRNQN